MERLLKLDWIPLYIHRLKASRTWSLPDYQWCWFMKLIIELADSDTPGYLPNDVDVLWRLAGARTRDFFLKRDGIGLVDREFRRTADGLLIYNPRLLEVLTEQSEKLHRKKKVKEEPLSLSSSGLFANIKLQNLNSEALNPEDLSLEALASSIHRLFAYYTECFHKDPRYKLTRRRVEKCQCRLLELIHSGSDLARAEATAKDAICNLAASSFHVQNGHTDWIDHLFVTQEMLQKRLDMGPGFTPPAQQSTHGQLRNGTSSGQHAAHTDQTFGLPRTMPNEPLPPLTPDNGTWASLLSALQARTSRLNYDTWLLPTRVLGLHGTVLYVRVPTPEFKHINEKFQCEIAESIQALGLPISEVRLIA